MDQGFPAAMQTGQDNVSGLPSFRLRCPHLPHVMLVSASDPRRRLAPGVEWCSLHPPLSELAKHRIRWELRAVHPLAEKWDRMMVLNLRRIRWEDW